jgi:hypothetical protein
VARVFFFLFGNSCCWICTHLEERVSSRIRWDSSQWWPSIFYNEPWHVASRELFHRVEAKSIHSLYYNRTMTHPRL